MNERERADDRRPNGHPAELTRPVWRSMLFAPANRPDLTAKLPRSQPDAVVLDLEDSVPADREGARPRRGAAPPPGPS